MLLVSFGILYTPEMQDRIITRPYAMRHLELESLKIVARESAGKSYGYPGPHASESKQSKPVAKPAPHRPAALRVTADAAKGPQTLVQPDITEPVQMTMEVPMPSLTIWTPSQQQAKTLVAPLPEKATAADATPSINTPNQELDLADLGISASNHPTMAQPVAPTTTSPLTVKAPNAVQMAPVTVTQTTAQPTPAAVLSISDVKMPEGHVTLPPVNETVEQSSLGAMLAANGGDGAPTLEKQAADAAAQSHAAGDENGNKDRANGEKDGSTSGSGADQGLTTEHFTLSKKGQFGAVVVGASLEEKFPELAGIWNERVAYTVYLHVGTSKSWILQYSLPRDTAAEDAGNVSRLEAPWPFNIVRPNLSPDSINTDAVLVHGFVNTAGKFEQLGLAFPPSFSLAQFVLDSLNQWEFRPAARNGKPERVEVLLIIPEEREE